MPDYSFKLAEQIGSRACYGLICLNEDQTLEHDLKRIIPTHQTSLYVSRIYSDATVNAENLSAMQDRMEQALSLMPNNVDFHAFAYGCTSASAVLGSEKIAALLTKNHPSAQATNPLAAMIAGCKALELRRVALLSPYIHSLSALMIAAIEKAGIEIVAYGSFNESNDQRVARIDQQSILEAACDLGQHKKAQSLLISCTNLRTYDIINTIEAKLDKPVLSSNQALAWQMLNITGQQANFQLGRLFADKV